jgi:acyl carrier protein
VTLESNLTNDLGADSLDSVELLMKAEREYGIKIQDEETSSIRTVGDLYNIILKKLSN